MAKLQIFPERVKYYLLDYKDANLTEFQLMFNKTSLLDLTKEELFRYYDFVTKQDIVFLKS